ncbi:UNKNOWN [Stylonychia lemnae]|uniref:Histidine acid phosphatase family protein n=1 Tax=Stylonychia lemnae TaxID=5949 RepID=A0A078BAZ4_STYLE|nr:UNKNOWN [Stylonychia lemnae]|eukprot:CDW91564.1 UNKNOWN [Stylonychia lemnae]
MLWLMQEHFENGPANMDSAGIRQHHLLGLQMHKKYLLRDEPFLNQTNLHNQLKVMVSDKGRTTISGSSYIQAFLENVKQLQNLKPRQINSLRQINRGMPKIKIHNRILEEAEKLENILPGNFQPIYLQSFLQSEKDQINLFSCKLLKDMEAYLQTYQSEFLFWKDVHRHFKTMGIYDKMAESVDMPLNKFYGLGFHNAYYVSCGLLAMRDIHPPDHHILSKFNYSDWDQIERVWMTHQIGVWNKWVFDVKNTRVFKFLLNKTDSKIECIMQEINIDLYQYRNSGIDSDLCQNQEQYFIAFSHDSDLQPIAFLFDLEQQWELGAYAGIFIIELHLEEEKLNKGDCVDPNVLINSNHLEKSSDDCFHVKVYFNEKQLFSELAYCDYKTKKCPYSKFKRDLMSKLMIDEIDSTEICYEPFTTDRHRRHRVHLM